MAGVTFGQLPEEEADFLAYLRTAGEVWARAVHDDAVMPQFEPLPVTEFLQQHAAAIKQYDVVDVYLGQRNDILQPKPKLLEINEGGTNIQKQFLHSNANPFVRYKRGEYRAANVLSSSNLGFPSTWFDGQLSHKHPRPFIKWATNILNWMRRRTPESIPVHQCNYETRATSKLAAACRRGLKLGV
jgi:hypothetical protein